MLPPTEPQRPGMGLCFILQTVRIRAGGGPIKCDINHLRYVGRDGGSLIILYYISYTYYKKGSNRAAKLGKLR